MSIADYRESFKPLFDAIYNQVFQDMEGRDCAWMDHPGQGRRFLADLREYLDRHAKDGYTPTWGNIATMYDAKSHPDWGYEDAFDEMCRELTELSVEYPAGQKDVDKEDRFTGFFDGVSEYFMDGGYFIDGCD